jgi:hypothetical protein
MAKVAPSVKRILDEAARDVKKNGRDFKEANQTPIGEARKDSEDLSTKLNKDGK